MLNKSLRLYFLGGVGEIGKNMTAIEYGDHIIIVDCGSSFPPEDMPGVDLLIPDISYIIENKHKIKGIVLTHGHEDHIGSMPFLLKELGSTVPVYGSKLTLAFLEHKTEEYKIKKVKSVCVNDGDTVNIGCFNVEFIKVSHSISGAFALSINTPSGIIFHTGDYKIDYTPIDGKMTNLARIAEIGKKGVLLMLSESTNVEREGYTMSETTVGKSFDKLFSQNIGKRIIIATFSSNIHRLQQILDLADKYGRKIAFNGRSMLNSLEMATKIGELHYKAEDIVDIDKVSKLPPERVVIISTGAQGEPMSALARMASGETNSKITVGPMDTVIVSASPIPGNERLIYNVINNLYKKGASVVYGALEEVHVSGHACKEEIKLMLSLVKPRFLIPVHGEYRHLKQQAELAESLGIRQANILIPCIGACVNVKKNGIAIEKTVEAGNMFVDGYVIGDADSSVIKDRLNLGENGFLITIIKVSSKDNRMIGEPDIITRGIHALEKSTEQLKDIVIETFLSSDYTGEENNQQLKADIRKDVRKWLLNNTLQRPMILPIIINV